MRLLRLAAVLIIGLGLLAPGVYAAGYANSGIGTQAMAMGNAFRAVADDWTAAYYNPAGYATIYDNQLGANVAFLHLRNELVPDYRRGESYETGMFNDRTNYNHHEVLNNPSAGFAVRLPFWGETVFGLSAYQPFDHNITWQLYQAMPAYNDSANIPGDQFSNNLDIVAFQLTAAREFIVDKLSIGVGLQVLRGDLLFTNLYFRDNPYGAPLNLRPYDKITQFVKNDGYGFGFGLTAGALWKLSDGFNVGFTARLPFDINVDGDTRMEFTLPKNSSLWMNSDSAAIANPGTAGQLFLSGATVVAEADFEAEIQLPPSLGVGLAFEVSDRVTFALDGELTFWSKVDGFSFEYSGFSGLTGPADTAAIARNFFTSNTSNPVSWKDAGAVMAGVRIEATDFLTLLGGASFDYREVSSLSVLLPGVSAEGTSSTEEDEFMPQLTDQNNRYSVNGGVQFHINQWDLGLAATYNDFPNVTQPNVLESDGGAAPVSFAGDLKSQTFETVLSINYRF